MCRERKCCPIRTRVWHWDEAGGAMEPLEKDISAFLGARASDQTCHIITNLKVWRQPSGRGMRRHDSSTHANPPAPACGLLREAPGWDLTFALKAPAAKFPARRRNDPSAFCALSCSIFPRFFRFFATLLPSSGFPSSSLYAPTRLSCSATRPTPLKTHKAQPLENENLDELIFRPK